MKKNYKRSWGVGMPTPKGLTYSCQSSPPSHFYRRRVQEAILEQKSFQSFLNKILPEYPDDLIQPTYQGIFEAKGMRRQPTIKSLKI